MSMQAERKTSVEEQNDFVHKYHAKLSFLLAEVSEERLTRAYDLYYSDGLTTSTVMENQQNGN